MKIGKMLRHIQRNFDKNLLPHHTRKPKWDIPRLLENQPYFVHLCKNYEQIIDINGEHGTQRKVGS